jgi:hypothetical protein
MPAALLGPLPGIIHSRARVRRVIFTTNGTLTDLKHIEAMQECLSGAH